MPKIVDIDVAKAEKLVGQGIEISAVAERMGITSKKLTAYCSSKGVSLLAIQIEKGFVVRKKRTAGEARA